MPDCNNRQDLLLRLNIDIVLVNSALDFLLSKGFVVENDGVLDIGLSRIHIDSQSYLDGRHQMNWRSKCIESLENKKREDLHFSAVYGLSKEDIIKVKDVFLEAISKCEAIVGPSEVEDCCVVITDIFSL